MQLDFCPHCFLDTTEGICPQCGFAVSEYQTPEKALKPGTIVGRNYKIGRVLGIGGFGITYTGYDLRTNARYAIKEYMPSQVAIRGENGSLEVPKSEDRETYDQGLAMFLEETNILITLTRCPSIVQAFDFIHENKTGYLIMEFLDGVSLKAILRESGTVAADFALEVLLKVADALRSVHNKGLLHRDISPENIMVMPDNSVKLIDFGAARFFVGSKNKDATLILKPGFAPPEQYTNDGTQGEWTDIYALAATYYKVITGNTLPDARTRAIHDTVERLDNHYVSVSHHVGLTIHQALSLNYKQRPQNIDQFVDDLLGRPAYTEAPGEPAQAAILQQPTEEIKQPTLFDRWFKEKPAKKEKPPKVEAQPKPRPKSQPVYDGTPVGTVVEVHPFVRKKKPPKVEAQPKPQPDYGGGIPVGTVVQLRPFVRVVSGSVNLGQWTIPADREMSVGRDFKSCDLVVYGNPISRKHCTVTYSSQSNCFLLTDYSSNGTYLADGTRMQPGAVYALDAGSVVLLASQDYIMEMGVKE